MDARLKTYPIELDRTRQLTINLNTLAEAETLTGLSVFDGNGLFADRSAVNLRAILFAFLKPDDPELTLDEVGSLIGLGDVRPIYAEVLKAFAEVMPEASPEDGEEEGGDEGPGPTAVAASGA